MLKIQQNRFNGEIIPQTADIICLPDKVGRAGNLHIRILQEVQQSHKDESRVVTIQMAMKSTQLHPFPMDTNQKHSSHPQI